MRREHVRFAVGCDSTVEKLRELAREEEREACARLIEGNCITFEIIGGAEKTRLTPRREGDRNGLAYAVAIRARRVKEDRRP